MQSIKSVLPWISLGNLNDLNPTSSLHKLTLEEKLIEAKKNRFEGVAGINSEIDAHLFRSVGLDYATSLLFLNLTQGMEGLFRAKDLGASSVSVLLGYGLESKSEIDSWIENIQKFSAIYQMPVYLETHRGTITQDIFTTLELIKKHPYLQFTGDFSHWYNGQLLGQHFEDKVEALIPVFERTAMLHGRIASAGCIQPPMNHISRQTLFHYKKLWLEVLTRTAASKVPFVIELLSHRIGYDPGVQKPDGRWEDLADRWQDALWIKQKVNNWFNTHKSTNNEHNTY